MNVESCFLMKRCKIGLGESKKSWCDVNLVWLKFGVSNFDLTTFNFLYSKKKKTKLFTLFNLGFE